MLWVDIIELRFIIWNALFSGTDVLHENGIWARPCTCLD